MNPYLEHIRGNLPRLLSLTDTDATSESYGMGDRYHWAWGLIDFGNGTFQGAAHGLARLWNAGLWPYDARRDHFIARIDAMFKGAARLTRANGSLEEAFPYEGSFCVTALVAFDLLCAMELLQGETTPEMQVEWQRTVNPMIGYLKRADETHAMISNHLATAVAALVRWNRLTGDVASDTRARELLARILGHQSSEGWFLEYEGADPGYQSLCTYYLADVHRLRPDLKLAEPLGKSIRFLWYFAHPDGSFGGVYGSRCTRFYYPAGMEALAREVPEALSLAVHMASSIAANRVVTLSAMDEPNLVPMFNAYCWAAVLWKEREGMGANPVPACQGKSFRVTFPETGLWVDAGPDHYTVISSTKGGVVAHFRAGKASVVDGGVVVRDPKGRLGSSQAYAASNRVRLEGDVLTIAAQVSRMPKRLATPLQFLALRVLCVTAFRSSAARERIKQWLVRLLITGQERWPAEVRRTIHLGPELSVCDDLIAPEGYRRVDASRGFVAIHMASQGYWQLQDEEGA